MVALVDGREAALTYFRENHVWISLAIMVVWWTRWFLSWTWRHDGCRGQKWPLAKQAPTTVRLIRWVIRIWIRLRMVSVSLLSTPLDTLFLGQSQPLFYVALLSGQLAAYSYDAQGNTTPVSTLSLSKRSLRALSVNPHASCLYAAGKAKSILCVSMHSAQFQLTSAAPLTPPPTPLSSSRRRLMSKLGPVCSRLSFPYTTKVLPLTESNISSRHYSLRVMTTAW
jgi:hypothetical protein